MLSRFLTFSLILFNTFTQCHVQVNKDHLTVLTSTLKRLMTIADTEQGDFGAQLEICQTEFAKIEFINEQLIKESAGLTRTSFNLIKTKKTDKTGSARETESQKILLPYYMKLQELLAQIDQRLRMGLDCLNKMAQVHNDRIKAVHLEEGEEAHFATVESDIDHIKAEMLEILSNAQQQRELYRLNADIQWSLFSKQLPVVGYRAIVYDFAKVTFDAAMKYCESDKAGMFVPGSGELIRWLKTHAKEPVWIGHKSENLCIVINPNTGQSETSDCDMETVGFICVKETMLSSKNVNELIKKFTANITATAKQWPPTIWRAIKDTLAQKD